MFKSTLTPRLMCAPSIPLIVALGLCGVPAQSQTPRVPFLAAQRAGGPILPPFADNNGQIPPQSAYDGPLFKLSHQYPSTLPPAPANLPWRQAIHDGRIEVSNAAAYVAALKAYVGPDMRVLLADYANWNGDQRGWYEEPWLGTLREAIHGTYVGSTPMSKDLFAGSGLVKDFTTYVLTLYDKRGAYTLSQVWGSTAENPNLNTQAAQFAEGAVVVKAAFSTANADTWPVMQGAQQWPLYITVNATTGDHQAPQVDPTSFFQFDIIVKDTASAPRTGWVFSTLVYDKDAPGTDFWDKMVPLGAMWGNDPEVNTTRLPSAELKENWINPNAPAYSTMTLGWGGRLSGPNDGAVNPGAFASDGATTFVQNLASSSCMSCHGVAEWPMQSFLLPTAPVETLPPSPPQFPPAIALGSVPPDPTGYLGMWPPGSPQWMRWFQSRPGTEAQDLGSVAFDYDMVFVFKSLPQWQKAQQRKGMAASPALLQNRGATGSPSSAEMDYRGRPFGGR